MRLYAVCTGGIKMTKMSLKVIGYTEINQNGFFIQLMPEYAVGIKGLEGFSHLSVLYWFDQLDTEEMKVILEIEKPYVSAPDVLGVFATRGPMRPNLIAYSVAEILMIDQKQGRIQVSYLDAEDGSPLIDLKPYTPSIERVEAPRVPEWCSHWPENVETAGEFNWEAEFNF